MNTYIISYLPPPTPTPLALLSEQPYDHHPPSKTYPTLLTEESQGRCSYDHHPSNEHFSYNYAGKAWQNFSITRSKGSTKEKNKKTGGSTNITLRTERSPPNAPSTLTPLALLS
ncbi:uncharacterized protein BO95DRAFT_443635, partial [Aspergillus brunneoviolaceus CBS 621.78]